MPSYSEFYTGYTLEHFEKDLQKLSALFTFMPLKEALRLEEPSASLSKPVATITLDDGFDLVRSGVMDVLDRYGISATAFLVTYCVDNQNLMWRNKLSAIRCLSPPETHVGAFNRLAQSAGFPEILASHELMGTSVDWPMERKDEFADELWRACDLPPLHEFLDENRPYFTGSTLREWIDHRHSLGLHTATHVFCDRLDEASVNTEIVRPANLLKQRYGLDWLPFSYPFGVRLPEGRERALCDEGIINCALGLGGFVSRPTASHQLERVSAEGHHKWEFAWRVLWEMDGLLSDNAAS